MGICECSKESQQTLRPSTREEANQALVAKKEALQHEAEDTNPDTQDYQMQGMSMVMTTDITTHPDKDGDDQGESGATDQIQQPELHPTPVQKDEHIEKPAMFPET